MKSTKKDAKRDDAVSKIATSMENAIIGGKSVLSFAVTGQEVASGSIAGATPTVGTTYIAGDANYTALGIKQEDFVDPSSGDNYKVGVTTLVGGKYEIAGALEDGASKRARVVGNWSPRAVETLSGSTSTGSTRFVISDTGDINKIRVGDTVDLDAGGTGLTVNSVSNDGLTLTLDTASTDTATTIALAAAESAGLIDSVSSTGALLNTPVTNGEFFSCLFF